MPSKTSRYPWDYPLSTDKIAQGAVNIQDRAEQTQDSFFEAPNAHTATAPFTDYPLGMSIFRNSQDTTWPTSYGHVVTYVTSTAYAHQIWMRYTTNPTTSAQYWVRQGWMVNGSPTWGEWQTLTGAGAPVAFAAGLASVPTTTGNQVDSAKVTFPSGRFTSEPEVQATARSVRPDYVSVSVSDITTSSMTIYVSRPRGDAATSVNWNAIQS